MSSFSIIKIAYLPLRIIIIIYVPTLYKNDGMKKKKNNTATTTTTTPPPFVRILLYRGSGIIVIFIKMANHGSCGVYIYSRYNI